MRGSVSSEPPVERPQLRVEFFGKHDIRRVISASTLKTLRHRHDRWRALG